MSHALVLGLTIVATSALVLCAMVLVVLAFRPWRGRDLPSPDLSEPDAVFVFRDDALIDCSDRGRQLLASISAVSADRRSELDHLMGFLETRFSDVKQHLRQLVARGSLELGAQDDSGLVLRASRKNGLTHLRLVETRAEGALVALDRLSFEAMRDDLAGLNAIARHMPVLAWRCDRNGQIVWANTPYIEAFLAVDAGRTGLTWPMPDLFAGQTPDAMARLSLDMGDHRAWFAHSTTQDAAGELHFATPIDLAVQTETSRREMMQVLTRTFASLPTGLALFDTERRLQVFNPALVDLMGLDPMFLAARPSFEQFLYTLRELRMLPEPRDFVAWRNEIAEMERAAEEGIFSEEWCLDRGRIFHVTGRPQPGGALAFFFNDVTSDAMLARTLRTEIEISQTVFDGLQDAVIAFNPAGDTLLSNQRYKWIWGEDPCSDLADMGLGQALGLWQRASATTQFWGEVGEFAKNAVQDEVLQGSVCLMDGTTLGVQARKLRHDCLMITFRPLVMEKARNLATTLRQAKALAAPDILEPLSAFRDRGAGDAPAPAPKTPSRKGRVVQHAGSRARV
jgi:PAS domain-containing protein